MKELTSQGLDSFFFKHVMRLQPHLTKMTVLGCLADTTLKDKIAVELEADVIKLKSAFIDAARLATGDQEVEPNPNSPKQLRNLLFERLNLVGRGNSVDKENRQRIRDSHKTGPEAAKVLDALDIYLKESKFLSTYAKMIVDPDDKIRCEYKQFGTQEAPGRLSSSSVMWGSGMNLQNQPKRAYPMFIADEGYMLTYFDMKQAEAKIVAYLWNVAALKENFIRAETEEGFDVHRGNASRIFKVPYDEVPTEDRDDKGEPTLRYLGKRCVHGLNYRMQPPKLASVCNIPIQQAANAYHAYHRAFPEIQAGWAATVKEVQETKMLTTPLGRRLIFLDRLTEDNMDSIIAFKPQSTIGDKVCSVIYQCEEDSLWPNDARMWMNIHDALIALHRSEDKEIVKAIMKRHAESPIYIRGEPVSIGTDFKHSKPDEKGVHRWSTLK